MAITLSNPYSSLTFFLALHSSLNPSSYSGDIYLDTPLQPIIGFASMGSTSSPPFNPLNSLILKVSLHSYNYISRINRLSYLRYSFRKFFYHEVTLIIFNKIHRMCSYHICKYKLGSHQTYSVKGKIIYLSINSGSLNSCKF